MAAPISYQDATVYMLNRLAEIGKTDDPAMTLAEFKTFCRNKWGNPANFEAKFSCMVWFLILENQFDELEVA